MMLEKALAKYYGGYKKIEGGFVHLALCDMIPGSIGQDIDLTTGQSRNDIATGKLWSNVLRFYKQGFLLGAGSPSGKDTDVSTFVSSLLSHGRHLCDRWRDLSIAHDHAGHCARTRLQPSASRRRV
jgi:hypothetical protein